MLDDAGQALRAGDVGQLARQARVERHARFPARRVGHAAVTRARLHAHLAEEPCGRPRMAPHEVDEHVQLLRRGVRPADLPHLAAEDRPGGGVRREPRHQAGRDGRVAALARRRARALLGEGGRVEVDLKEAARQRVAGQRLDANGVRGLLDREVVALHEHGAAVAGDGRRRAHEGGVLGEGLVGHGGLGRGQLEHHTGRVLLGGTPVDGAHHVEGEAPHVEGGNREGRDPPLGQGAVDGADRRGRHAQAGALREQPGREPGRLGGRRGGHGVRRLLQGHTAVQLAARLSQVATTYGATASRSNSMPMPGASPTVM